MSKQITTSQLREIFNGLGSDAHREPWMRGTFLIPPTMGIAWWIALDNTTWDCCVEEFPTKEIAEAWLNREFEMSDFYHHFGNGAVSRTMQPAVFTAWLEKLHK